MIWNFHDFSVHIVGMLFFGVFLHVPLPVAGVHARAAPVGFLARMMTPHVLNDLRTPASSEIAPVAQEITRLFLAVGRVTH